MSEATERRVRKAIERERERETGVVMACMVLKHA